MKRMLLALLMGMFLISCVSAFDFDNVKNYDEETKTIVIKNAFGFGEKLAEIQLLTSLENYVIDIGDEKQLVAETYFKDFVKEKGSLKRVDVYDEFNNFEERDVELRYKVVNEIEEIVNEPYDCKITDKGNVCKFKNVVKKRNEIEWIKFNSIDELPNKNIVVGLFVDVKPGERREWIPEWYGERIYQWAEWVEALNVGLQYAVPFNSSGEDVHNGAHNFTIYGGAGYSPLKIGDGINVETGGSKYVSTPSVAGYLMVETGDFALDFWGNHTTSCGGDYCPLFCSGERWTGENGICIFISNSVLSAGVGASNVDASHDYDDGTLHHIVFMRSGTNTSLWIDGSTVVSGSNGNNGSSQNGVITFGNTNTKYLTAGVDEHRFWNRSLTITEVSNLYNSGSGLYYIESFGPGDNVPVIAQINPVDYYNSSVNENDFTIEGNDTGGSFGIINVSLFWNGVRNLTITNVTAESNLTLNNSINVVEGLHNWSGEVCDVAGQCTFSGNRTLRVDLTNPSVLVYNPSGVYNVFGLEENTTMFYNTTDDTIKSSLLERSWNATNLTLTNGNNSFDLNVVPNGSQWVRVWAEDEVGFVSNNISYFNISYYSHNLTFKDNVTSGVITPSCLFNGTTYNSYDYHLSIANTNERTLNCWMSGYSNTTFTLNESNKSNLDFFMDIPYLNLSFSEDTNVTITWLGGSLSFQNVNVTLLPIRNITALGEVQVAFNEDSQLFSFESDNVTSVNAALLVEDVDFDQPVKVLASNEEINNALVSFYKENKITYSAFTDISGIAHILVNDGTTYEVHVIAEGYDEYIGLKYIPTSSTDTIIINLIGEGGVTGNYYFTSSCLSVVGIEQNCSWFVRSYRNANITFNYTWAGTDYSVTSQSNEANLTLWVNESNAPVNVTASVNPSESYSVEWDGLANRSIQLDFDTDDIKDESLGILSLFYAIIFIIGIMLMVVVNRMPHMEGKGIWGLVVWFCILAIDFPLLWFIVVPALVYAVFKTFWGSE